MEKKLINLIQDELRENNILLMDFIKNKKNYKDDFIQKILSILKNKNDKKITFNIEVCDLGNNSRTLLCDYSNIESTIDDCLNNYLNFEKSINKTNDYER